MLNVSIIHYKKEMKITMYYITIFPRRSCFNTTSVRYIKFTLEKEIKNTINFLNLTKQRQN